MSLLVTFTCSEGRLLVFVVANVENSKIPPPFSMSLLQIIVPVVQINLFFNSVGNVKHDLLSNSASFRGASLKCKPFHKLEMMVSWANVLSMYCICMLLYHRSILKLFL